MSRRTKRAVLAGPAIAALLTPTAAQAHGLVQRPRSRYRSGCSAGRRRSCSSPRSRARFGLAPRAAPAAWAALGACLLLWVVGPIVDAPTWLMDLSPYTYVPALPAADFKAGPLLELLAVAAAITAAGVAGFRRRDVGV